MMQQADPQSVIRNPQSSAASPLKIVFTGHVDHRKSTIIGRGLFCCRPLLFSVTLAVSLVALMSGCSVEARKARYFASAGKDFHAGDYEKAKIEYMDLVLDDPRDEPPFLRACVTL